MWSLATTPGYRFGDPPHLEGRGFAACGVLGHGFLDRPEAGRMQRAGRAVVARPARLTRELYRFSTTGRTKVPQVLGTWAECRPSWRHSGVQLALDVRGDGDAGVVERGIADAVVGGVELRDATLGGSASDSRDRRLHGAGEVLLGRGDDALVRGR